jgi:L-rhamnose mutarotase
MASRQQRLQQLLTALAPAPRATASSARSEPPSALALAGTSGFAPMGAHGDIDSYTGGGGCTGDGLIRKCSMLRVKPGGDIEGYKEWHRNVWPEMQAHILRSGTTNYSIFSRPDGVLFLYEEVREDVAAAAAAAGDDDIAERWQKLMDPFLDRDWEWNGPLKHVMYMDPDPATRLMTCVDLPQLPLPSLAANPPWGDYESYTGGGGWSLSGRRRQASQLKCREEGVCQRLSVLTVFYWHCYGQIAIAIWRVA